VTEIFASTFSTILIVLAFMLTGYLVPDSSFLLVLGLFTFVAGMHSFRVCTIVEMLQDSLGDMKQIIVGQDSDWLRRAPWIGLLCGEVLRLGHDLILGLGAA
jgi:hypothetical protein